MIERTPLASRFEAKVDRSAGPDACHPWTAGTYPARYGKVNAGGIRGRTLRAPRVAYALARGIDPLDLDPAVFVCHTCDNPLCCNDRHLFDGNAADNAADCKAKGRTVKGRHPRRVLDTASAESARSALAAGSTVRAAARAHGVSETTMRRVRDGAHWTGAQ